MFSTITHLMQHIIFNGGYIYLSYKQNLLWILQKVLDNKEELIFEHSGWMPMLTPWVHNNVKVFGYK